MLRLHANAALTLLSKLTILLPSHLFIWQHLQDTGVRAKIEKLINAGVLQMK
jgi:hypothetical protein